MKITCLRTVAFAICSSFFLTHLSSLHAQQIAFPGAEGIGAYTTRWRGTSSVPTTVFEVTNLSDVNSSGSLRYALGAPAVYRTIVFRVSGTIHLTSRLTIRGNTTIAGQTAPGGGICLADYPVVISGNNVIMRYVRVRMGDKNQNKGKVDGSGGDDALGNLGNKNLIIDHCSVSWSSDEALTVYRGDSVTMQWNFVSEPLNYSYHFETGDADYEEHGYVGIWGGIRASFHHNLLAHAKGRMPRFAGNSTYAAGVSETVDFRNNVIYHWLSYSTNGGEGGNYNLVNNYYKYGPQTSTGSTSGVPIRYEIMNPSKSTALPYPKLYVSGNYVEGSPTNTSNNWRGIAMASGSLADTVQSKVDVLFAVAPVTTQSATEAYEIVLNSAGAILPKRDTLDERIVINVKNRTGRVIDVQGGYPHGRPYEQTVNAWPQLDSLPAPADTDHDGMPDTWETSNGLNPNNAADRSIIAPNGYTMLENYLNSITSATLPLKVLSFQGVLDGKQVKLTWSTTNEVNTSSFEIEKSTNGKDFSAAGNVAAKNTAIYNSYSFADNAAYNGLAYYRIKMIDKDGQFTYSSVVSVNGKKVSALNISPNPAHDLLKIQHTAAIAGSEIKILSTDGKSLKSLSVAAGKTSTVLNVNALAKGVYLLQYSNGADKVTSQFIKQ